jgi:CHAD domain-containing protein
MTIDLEILDRPASEGARTLALALLADAADAAGRVGTPGDAEALHDFRVAVRRLRSTVRAWGPALAGALRDKDVRRLRRIARATGPARDAEVLGGWLAQARSELDARYHPAADWLAGRIAGHHAESHARGAAEAAARLREIHPVLARRLAAAPEPAAGPLDGFGSALAALVRAHARNLRDALGRVSGPDAVAPAHQARIAAKRLRYLLEPLRGLPAADATPAVKGLKALQDLLGELHDTHVAGEAAGAARVAAAAERLRGAQAPGSGPGLRPGLLALERLAARRAGELYARLDAEALRDRAQPLLDRAYEVVGALEARAGVGAAADEKPRRRFLLLRVPEPAQWGESAEVEKGWLPGDRVRECFGVGRSRAGESFFRAVATGIGPQRAEASEEVSREVFEAFWPLTEGRRIHKRCHLPPGEPGWRFDEYLDRALVLAVAELGNEGEPPEWLEPYVVREVTGERGYQDDALARRPPRARAASRAPAPGDGRDAPGGEPEGAAAAASGNPDADIPPE